MTIDYCQNVTDLVNAHVILKISEILLKRRFFKKPCMSHLPLQGHEAGVDAKEEVS